MSLQITGTLKGAKPTEDKGSYKMRDFLLDISSFNPQTGEHYENMLALSLFGDKCNLIDGFQKGDKITVSFNLRGGKDKATDKWRWVNVAPYKIESAGQPEPATVVTEDVLEDPDDLPF